MNLKINDTFTKELPGDILINNNPRQVTGACYSFVTPTKTKSPVLIHFSNEVAELLGISKIEAMSIDFLNVFTGNKLLPESKPYAMCYGGHQFGNWAGQLGDGRAINLAEIEFNGKRLVIQLKGAGPTPYSRNADGLAVLRSSIREYLCSEAIHHLGVPTTRALSLALTGDNVLRDILYNGNPNYEKGAIVCRVASSFLRFGNYELLSSRGDMKTLKTLIEYTTKYFYPELEQSTKAGYIQFFKIVSAKTLDMIIHWQRVGFVHGVMNTDNMSILGLTIDYGPYGWLEGYDKGWTPNTTDKEFKRYQYGNQPNIALSNLLKLANAIYPLVEEAAPFEEILDAFTKNYELKYIEMMKSKLGLELADEADLKLIRDLESNLQQSEIDMTIFFRSLSSFKKDQISDESLSFQFLKLTENAFYKPEELKGETLLLWNNWMQEYGERLQKEIASDDKRKLKMNKTNPKYVLRNYMAQLAIDGADKGDYSIIEELFTLLKKPYDEQIAFEKWFSKRPEWARSKIGCSMLSCSS